MNLVEDIYYNEEYISLYLKDSEELFTFEYIEGDKIFVNKTIKRPIINIGNLKVNDGYYDLETAYGYGGFYTNTEDKEFLTKAFEEYELRCKNENIIAEFIRFHPFNNFTTLHANFLDFNIYDRDVVIKDLSKDILGSYTSKVRNCIKRANEKVIFKSSDNIHKFKELYDDTMLKNDATDFYFFDKHYYENLLKSKNVKLYEIIFENEIIAMGFFMFSDKIGHYHLSANTSMSYKLNSNYAMLHSIFEISKELGLDYFILGGGTTSGNTDTLLKFKKKFSQDTKPFYIAGKIYNNDVYNKYVSSWEEQSEDKIKFFLKYRLEIK